jgi:hypothetical protein
LTPSATNTGSIKSDRGRLGTDEKFFCILAA